MTTSLPDQRIPEASAHASVAQLHALTSLRFVAAALVVLFHYKAHLFADNGWPTPKLAEIGYTGVTFFFILSGFILAYNYWQTDFSQSNNLIRFFQARIARVYPVYICSLAVSSVLFR
jgi:peptidoglycan/LPS O-acetylase OafA/YrhL